MSIPLTIYDVFGNMVPGLLYLYVLNEALVAFRLPSIDMEKLKEAWALILVGVAAYILGHLFNVITHYAWGFFRKRETYKKAALAMLGNQVSGISFDFKPSDSGLLFEIIRHHDAGIANTIESYRTNCTMLRNISQGLILYAILQAVLIVREPALWGSHLVIFLMAVFFSVLAAIKSAQYLRWYYEEVFGEAVNYGASLAEVVAVSRRITAQVGREPADTSGSDGKHAKRAKPSAVKE